MTANKLFARAAAQARRDAREVSRVLAATKPGTIAHVGWSLLCAVDAARARAWAWMAGRVGA